MNERKHFIKRWLLANNTSVKSFSFWKASAEICNLRVPVYKGVPLTWMIWHPSLNDDWQPSVLLSKCFTFRKVSAKICNFRVHVYKGVPLPWMKWNPSFNDDWWRSILMWKVLLSERWALNYATLVFPFIRGFPSHEWNETRALTMTAGQVYDCEKFHFHKS